MYLPSLLSGDLRISNTTTRETAKRVISNTTAPAMIPSFFLEIALQHFIIEFRFVTIVIRCSLGSPYSVSREDSQIKVRSCRYTDEMQLSVSLRCRFSEFCKGNPLIQYYAQRCH